MSTYLQMEFVKMFLLSEWALFGVKYVGLLPGLIIPQFAAISQQTSLANLLFDCRQ